MRVIFPTKGDVLSFKGGQAMIANGDAMGVATEIAQDGSGPSQGMLGVDDPFLRVQRLQEGGKGFRLLQKLGYAAEVQFLSTISALQSVDELATKNRLKHV